MSQETYGHLVSGPLQRKRMRAKLWLALAVVSLVVPGCGASSADDAAPAKPNVVARAELHGATPLEEQAPGKPFRGFAFTGSVGVMVELLRHADGSYRLLMRGISHDTEPHTLHVAAGTSCDKYARTYDAGDTVFSHSYHGRGDAPMGGTVHEVY